MMTTKHLRLAPLARVSRLKGRDPTIAERDYRETLERWGTEQANVTMLEFRCDHDRTGGSLKGRAGLDAVMALIHAGECDGVVVPEAKRFGRNLRESLNLIQEIEAAGALFVPLDVPGADAPTDRNYKLALHLWLSIAEHELSGYKQQWLTRKRRWAQSGAHVGKAQLGYSHIEHPVGEDPVGLEPNDDADLVREAFRVLCTDGLDAACKVLGKPASKARPILSNDVYLGITSWNDPELGDIVVRDAHKPLVDPGVFHRAQKVLAGEPVRGQAPPLTYALSRSERCVCGRCGLPLAGSLSHKRQGYRCSSNGSRRVERCGSFGLLMAADLEDRVRELLAEAAASPAASAAFRAGLPSVDDVVAAQYAELEQAQAALDSALEALAELEAMDDRPAWHGAALADQQSTVAAAQAVFDAASVLELDEAPPVTPEDVANAPASELRGLLERLDLTVIVEPTVAKGTPISERVTIAPA